MWKERECSFHFCKVKMDDMLDPGNNKNGEGTIKML